MIKDLGFGYFTSKFLSFRKCWSKFAGFVTPKEETGSKCYLASERSFRALRSKAYQRRNSINVS